LIIPSAQYTGYLADYQTRIYSIRVPVNAASLTLRYSRVPLPVRPRPHWGGGHPLFSIAYQTIPVRESGVWANYFDVYPGLRVPAPGVWYIAVHALEESSYTLSVLPFGDTTQTRAPVRQPGSAPAKNQLSGGPIAGIVIAVVAVAGLAVLGVVVLWKKLKGRNFKKMTDDKPTPP